MASIPIGLNVRPLMLYSITGPNGLAPPIVARDTNDIAQVEEQSGVFLIFLCVLKKIYKSSTYYQT